MMRVMRSYALGIIAISLAMSLPLRAESGDPAVIQNKLNAMFRLTTTTADLSDIVTPGDVVTLRRPGLVMFAVGSPLAPTNNYKNGQIGQGFGTVLQMSSQDTVQRRFVPGEKFWVTRIMVQNDCVSFDLYSDPYNDIRYSGTLKIMYPEKKTVPPVDTLMQMVSGVFTVEGSGEQAAQPAPPSAPPAPIQAIAPPPPPPDQPPAPPKTIQVGQARDVVIATWGPPTKTFKAATKEVLYYPDMKVILIAGKVSDVQ